MTDGRTDGRTDGGNCNIPDALKKKRGDKKCLFYQDRLSHNAGQNYCRMLPAFCNTFDLHLALICLNDLCCVYL